MIFTHYFKEIKALKAYFVTIVSVVFFSYIIYAFFSDDLLIKLGDEDGFFEWLTALFFLVSSVIFLIVFWRTKNVFLLGLALIFFLGAGEEISWGQRLFGFATPESIKKLNTQREFNLHNLEFFDGVNSDFKKKKGLERIFEVNVLFRLFSVTFCVLIPLFFLYIRPRFRVNKKIQMPVAPVTIGVFFFISWLIFYSLKYAILPRGRVIWYYLSSGEIFEFTASFVYFLIALYFFKRKDDGFLGKYPVAE